MKESRPFCKCKNPKLRIFRTDHPNGEMDITTECKVCSKKVTYKGCEIVGWETESMDEDVAKFRKIQPDKKEDFIQYTFGDMRDFTHEEEEAYEESLLKISEDIGECFWDEINPSTYCENPVEFKIEDMEVVNKLLSKTLNNGKEIEKFIDKYFKIYREKNDG